jgi:cytoskeletal protein CcmA (bactofilin family)
MFKRKKIHPDSTDTLIGEGTVLEGNLKSEASIRIEGKIVGDIECKGDVTIGQKGVAHSNIQARSVIIAGSVRGNVTAQQSLSIHSTGKLQGNISTQKLVISEGGVFMGNSKMTSEAGKEKDKPESGVAMQTGQKPAGGSSPSPYSGYGDSAVNL